MSTTNAEATSTPGNVENSNGNNNQSRNNRNKKGKGKNNGQAQQFKGAIPEFGGTFCLDDEVPNGKECSLKDTLLATEVYVASNFPDTSKTMSPLFQPDPRNPSLSPPPEPTGDDADNNLKVTVYMKRLERHLDEEKLLANNLHRLFTIIWGQCSLGIQAKLKAKVEFLIKKEDGDCAWLINEVKQLMLGLGSGKYPLKVLAQAKIDLLRFQQGRLPTIVYYEKYMELVHAYERRGGELGNESEMLTYIDKWHGDVSDLDPAQCLVPPRLQYCPNWQMVPLSLLLKPLMSITPPTTTTTVWNPMPMRCQDGNGRRGAMNVRGLKWQGICMLVI